MEMTKINDSVMTLLLEGSVKVAGSRDRVWNFFLRKFPLSLSLILVLIKKSISEKKTVKSKPPVSSTLK